MWKRINSVQIEYENLDSVVFTNTYSNMKSYESFPTAQRKLNKQKNTKIDKCTSTQQRTRKINNLRRWWRAILTDSGDRKTKNARRLRLHLAGDDVLALLIDTLPHQLCVMMVGFCLAKWMRSGGVETFLFRSERTQQQLPSSSSSSFLTIFRLFRR